MTKNLIETLNVSTYPLKVETSSSTLVSSKRTSSWSSRSNSTRDPSTRLSNSSNLTQVFSPSSPIWDTSSSKRSFHSLVALVSLSFLLAPRLAKWFDEVNLEQSLFEAIMDLDRSFALELRLGVRESGFGSKSWVAWYIT